MVGKNFATIVLEALADLHGENSNSRDSVAC
jgi:hypothetical protein